MPGVSSSDAYAVARSRVVLMTARHDVVGDSAACPQQPARRLTENMYVQLNSQQPLTHDLVQPVRPRLAGRKQVP